MRVVDGPLGDIAETSLSSKPKRQAGARQGLTLGVAGFLPILSILSLAPAVPAIMARFSGVPHVSLLVPLMVTAPGLVVGLLSPMAGWVADRFGRRKPVLLASFFYGFFGVVPFFVSDLRLIFASRLAVGVSETFLLVIVSTLFADYYDLRQRRTWVTAQGVLGPALGALSLAAAGVLAGIGWNMVFLVYFMAFGVFLAMLAWCFEPERDTAFSRTTLVAGRPFPVSTAITYCTVTLLSSVIYYVVVVQGGVAFSSIGVQSAARIGVIMGSVSLAVPVGALVFNLLSRRVGGEWLIAGYLTLLGIGTAGVGLSCSEPVMIVFTAVQELGAGMTVTALIFWVSRLLSAEHRGRGFGFWTSAFFLGQFVSAAVVFEAARLAGGTLQAFVALGTLSLIGALLVTVFRARLPKPV